MSWGFRKSINLGGGFRINLSKSGIGYSFGSKGFRFGKSANGKNFVNIGAKGIYYRKYFDEESRTKNLIENHSNNQITSTNNKTLGNVKIYNSADAHTIQDSSSQMLLEDLNKITYRMSVLKYGIIASILIGFVQSWLFLITGLLLLIYLYNFFYNKVDISYKFDDSVSHYFDKLENSIKELGKSNKIWSIESEQKVLDKKYHAGASNLVDMKDSFIAKDCFYLIKTNVNIYKIKAGKEILYFFPDRVLILCNNKFGAVNYNNIDIELHKTRLIIDNKPSDANVVDYTWKYVNKKGDPDKRFKDNTRLFIIECDTIKLTSKTGLFEILKFSKNGCADNFCQNIKDINKLGFLKDVSNDSIDRSQFNSILDFDKNDNRFISAEDVIDNFDNNEQKKFIEKAAISQNCITISLTTKSMTNSRIFNEKCKWIPKNSNIKINGYNINGLVYLVDVKLSQKMKAGINPNLNVESNCKYEYDANIGYWPSYESLNPRQRATYLKLLEDGFNDKNINIGFVFIYFYGLEYRFFNEFNEIECDEIIEEVIRLKSLFSENYSFNGYASSFLDYSELLKYNNIGKFSANYNFNSLVGLETLISILTNKGENIKKDIALCYIKKALHPRTAILRCPKEFDEIFFYEFEKRYPEGFKCKNRNGVFDVTYHACSGDFSFTILKNLPKTVSDSNSFCNQFRDIINKSYEQLSEYSKYILKDNSSIYSKFLLPIEISSKINEITNFLNEIEANINEFGFFKIEYKNLLQKLGKENLNLKEYKVFLEFLKKYSLSCFPNLLFDKILIGQNVLFIFKCLDHKIFQNKDNFYMIDIITRFNSSLDNKYEHFIQIFIDKISSNEKEKEILKIRKQFIELSSHEKNIFSKIKLLSHRAKILFLSFFGSFFKNDIDMLKIIQKEYINSGFDKDDFHSYSMGAKEPVKMSENSEDEGFKIPKKKEKAEEFLDRKLLQEKFEETKDIVVVLNNILGEEKVNLINKEVPQKDNKPLLKYKDFILFISTKSIWERSKLEQEAKKYKLFLNKFIDDVNDYAIKEYDHTLIDENGDMFEINESLKMFYK